MSVFYQKHGYKEGHKRLEGNIRLDREDQERIEYLSDCAGHPPIGAVYGSYLTCYPLPSGEYYVVARTRQDFDAPRLGCVLTNSKIITMEEWRNASQTDIQKYLSPVEDVSLSQYFNSLSIQLKRYFEEDRRPTTLIGAVQAEAVTSRLLSSLLPELRSDFSVCTRCYKPRWLAGEKFDLLFAAPDSHTALFNDFIRINIPKPA